MVRRVLTVTDKPVWMVGCLVFPFILLLGLIDFLSPYGLSITVFYLIPISIAAWYGTRSLAYMGCVASVACWAIVEATAVQIHAQHWIPYWNTATRLVVFIIVAYLITELKKQLIRQKQLAQTDDLTGLLNRAGFLDHAAAVINMAERYRNTIAVAYIDLDGFKNVNDTLGHSQGDEVLKSVGNLLGRSSRKSDIVARLGGDEFAVLLPHSSLAGARIYFNNLHSALQSEMRQKGWPMRGISIGAAVFDHQTPELSDALRLADSLMYRAKETGQSSVVVEATAADA